MNIEVGDFLFGYPVVEVTDTLVVVQLPGSTGLSFDRTQFNAGVLQVLADAGRFVKGGSL